MSRKTDSNASSGARKPKRQWKPRWAYDRSMRAYEQNPRALRALRDLAPFHDDTPLS